MTGDTCITGPAYPFEAPGDTSGFLWEFVGVHVALSLVLYVIIYVMVLLFVSVHCLFCTFIFVFFSDLALYLDLMVLGFSLLRLFGILFCVYPS